MYAESATTMGCVDTCPVIVLRAPLLAVHETEEGGGSASPLVLQQVPKAKAGKNRMHLDLVTDEVDTEDERLQALGGRLHEGIQNAGPVRWGTMADPEGNEFCACTDVEW